MVHTTAICLLGLVAVAFAQDSSCQAGNCVIIQQCPKLFKILTTFPRDVNGFELLKRRNCGYEKRYPKVCCTSDEKFDGQTGNVNSNPNPNPNPINTNLNTNSHGVNGNGYDNRPTTDSPQRGQNGDFTAARQLLPSDCGRDLSNRIVGGNVTEITEYPWMALLEYRKPNGKSTACGGALINNRYVLTASHCLVGKALPRSWTLIAVRLGEYNIATNPDCIPDGESETLCADEPLSFGIEEQIVHEQYNPESNDQHYDIALLRLSDEVRFSNYIKPICLPSGPNVSEKLVAAGWGTTETKSKSELKLKVQLPLVDRSHCSQRYGRVIVPSQICAGGERGKDSCSGDSGGPLMQLHVGNNGDRVSRWEVAGVVSFGPTPCGMAGWPGVYSNVHHYLPWILSKIRP